MTLRKACLPLLVVMGIFVFAAGSAHATLSYVHPSIHGGACSLGDTSPCVSVLPGGILEDGDGTNIVQYQVVGVGGVVNGTTVDFTFAGTTAPTFGTGFQVLACGYEAGFGNAASPGIYDSGGGSPLSTSCTQLGNYSCPSLGDSACATTPAFTPPDNFITNDNCKITATLCLTFSAGTGFPSTWFFVEDVQTISSTNCNTDPNTGTVLSCQTTADGPEVSFLTETAPGGGGGPTPTPEPASIVLLAAGLVGVGALRRKRTA
jgi:hypothetical protein